MKKSWLLILPLIISLGACSKTPKEESKEKESSEPTASESIPVSEEESTSEPIESEEEISESESLLPSEESESTESEPILPSEESDEVISESESLPESEESDSESVEGGTYTLTFDDVPDPVSGSYPTPGEVTSASGAKFYLDSVMKGGGDHANHIQMKKQVAYIQNVTPVRGTLIFSVLKKVVENTGADVTGVPTVYVGTEKDAVTTVLEPRSTSESDGHIHYTYEAGEYSYYKIADESKYAMYVLSFTWAY